MLGNFFFLSNQALSEVIETLPCSAAQGRKHEAQFSDLGSQPDSCGESRKEQRLKIHPIRFYKVIM